MLAPHRDMRSESNVNFFKALLIIIVVVALEGIGYCAMWVHSRSMDFISNKNYFLIRDMLMGQSDPETMPRYLSVPHLGYIPYPGYKRHGAVQHNEDGYRGHRIERQHSDKLRILCLGGSTTYGYGVDLPSETYPAQLESLLNNKWASYSDLSRKYPGGAEVLNAGIDAGTSAEELQQYIFKYRYYHPDVVIVQSGVNDALLASCSATDFQLDYTDSRRLRFHLEPLPEPARLMMHSYFFSYFAIRLFYNDFADNGQDEFQSNGRQTFCAWSHVSIDSIIDHHSWDYYPFYQHTRSLYSEIISDSARLVVLPNILNKTAQAVRSKPRYDSICQININISHELSEKYQSIFVPFTFDSIGDPKCWIGDDCHLNAAGEHKKAEILIPYIIGAVTVGVLHH